MKLITRLHCNIKPVRLEDVDKLLLRNRSLLETINDPLKNISQLEPSRHRRLTGFMFNLVAAWVAYSFQPSSFLFSWFLTPPAMTRVDDDSGYLLLYTIT